MPLVVHSPYSGKPVKVRDEDVSRAIRDEEGRIFYVVERSNGQGYYASPTRQGSEKDEQRYLKMLEKSAAAEQHKRAATATPVHDATGQGRANRTTQFVRAAVALILLLALAYIILGYSGNLPEGVPNVLPGVSPPEEQPIEGPALEGTSFAPIQHDTGVIDTGWSPAPTASGALAPPVEAWALPLEPMREWFVTGPCPPGPAATT